MTATDERTAEERLETGHGPLAPSDDSVLRQFLHNQSEMNRQIGRSFGGRYEDDGEVSLSDAQSLVAFLNQAVLFRPVLNAQDPLLDRIDAFFAGSSTSTVLSAWPTPDLTPRGWILMGHPMFVVAPPLAVSPRPARKVGVDVERVKTPEQLATAEHVVVEGYPIAEASDAAPGSLLPAPLVDSDLDVRLGLVDGQPVAVGAALVSNGVINLAMDATLPGARRRGAWMAVVASRRAAAPELATAAFTSDFSRPGFVAMGFLPITRLTLWVRPGVN